MEIDQGSEEISEETKDKGECDIEAMTLESPDKKASSYFANKL